MTWSKAPQDASRLRQRDGATEAKTGVYIKVGCLWDVSVEDRVEEMPRGWRFRPRTFFSTGSQFAWMPSSLDK